MAKSPSDPRSRTMALEVERLLRQLGVDPEPKVDTPPQSLTPAQSVSQPRPASSARAAEPERGDPPRTGSALLSAAAAEARRRESPPPAPRPRSGGMAATTTAPVAVDRTELWALVALWARVSLGVTLGVAMTQWPYRTACGWQLWAYMAAVSAVMVTGGWTSLASWKSRNGPAHLVSLVLVLWGIALATEKTLPRIGYAAERASWYCPASRR